jgi:CRISPR-associated protein Cas2
MYVVLVYDVNVKRISKIYKLIKQYLHWTQNSTFEGEINKGTLNELKRKINIIINLDEDSIVIYMMQSDYYLEKDIIGLDKGKYTSFII